MEVLGPPARGPQEALDGAGVHLADIGRGLEGTAVAQALDDPHHGGQGELGVLQEGALVLAEALPAVGAVQPADVAVLADRLGHREVAGGEAIEGGAIGVGTGEPSQRSGPDSGIGRTGGLAGHETSPDWRQAFPPRF